MNGDPRDPFDDAIAHDLGAFSPDDIDASATLAAMRPALQRARSRHRLAVVGSSVAVLVIVVGAGGLLAGRHESHISVRSHSSTLPAWSTTSTSRNTGTTTTSRPDRSTSTTRPTTPPGDHTSTSRPTPLTTPGTNDHGGGGSGPPSTDDRGATTTTASAAPTTKTYTSVSGSVTIRFANGALTLDSYRANRGYQAALHTDQPDDVEVRFSNGAHEWRIRVRVQDGKLSKEISEN